MPALAAALIAFGVYLATASSEPGAWDIAENQTVPYILGIAHPTGFPAFTLAGWLFAHVVALGTVAWRLNVFSGLWTAAAAGGVALVARSLGAGAAEAGLAALAFAFGTEAWSQGVHADVHAMLLATMIYGLHFSLRYASAGRPRDAVIAAACCGLGLAVHPEAMFMLPPLAIALVVRGRMPLRAIALVAAGVVLPLALYLYFPVRSTYIAAHGLDPTAAPPISGAGTIAWDTSHPRTLDGFLDEVTGRTYGSGHALLAMLDVRRWPADAARWATYARAEVPAVVLVLAAAGLLGVALRTPRLALIAVAGPLGVCAFSFAYLTSPIDFERYLLPSFAVVVAVAAASAQLALPKAPPRLRHAIVALLLAVTLAVNVPAERTALSARDEDGGRRAIDEVRREIPDGAIVVAPWQDATSLAYAAFVERTLGSRIVVVGWPSQFASRYPDWTRARRVFLYADSYALGDLENRKVPAAWLVPVSRRLEHTVFEVRPPRVGAT